MLRKLGFPFRYLLFFAHGDKSTCIVDNERFMETVYYNIKYIPSEGRKLGDILKLAFSKV